MVGSLYDDAPRSPAKSRAGGLTSKLISVRRNGVGQPPGLDLILLKQTSKPGFVAGPAAAK
jgi:hypothetical protein